MSSRGFITSLGIGGGMGVKQRVIKKVFLLFVLIYLYQQTCFYTVHILKPIVTITTFIPPTINPNFLTPTTPKSSTVQNDDANNISQSIYLYYLFVSAIYYACLVVVLMMMMKMIVVVHAVSFVYYFGFILIFCLLYSLYF